MLCRRARFRRNEPEHPLERLLKLWIGQRIHVARLSQLMPVSLASWPLEIVIRPSAFPSAPPLGLAPPSVCPPFVPPGC